MASHVFTIAGDVLTPLREIEACFLVVSDKQKEAYLKLRFPREETSWQSFNEDFISPLFLHRRDPEYQQIWRQLLDMFSQAVLGGRCPPAESMLFVAFCLYRYLHPVYKEEQLTLDAAFGMMATQKAGNPVQRYQRQTHVGLALAEMAIIRESFRSAGQKMPTIHEAATQAVWNLDNMGVLKLSDETLVKRYCGQFRKRLEAKVRKLFSNETVATVYRDHYCKGLEEKVRKTIPPEIRKN